MSFTHQSKKSSAKGTSSGQKTKIKKERVDEEREDEQERSDEKGGSSSRGRRTSQAADPFSQTSFDERKWIDKGELSAPKYGARFDFEETTRESLKEIFDADDNYWNALNGKVVEAAQNHDLGPGNKADWDEIDLYRKGYKRDKNFLFRPDIDFVKVAEITLKVVAILYVLYGPTIRRRDSIDGGENSGGPSGYGQFANYEGNIIRTAVNALHARRRSAYIPGYYLW
jgi:hypothetical protein